MCFESKSSQSPLKKLYQENLKKFTQKEIVMIKKIFIDLSSRYANQNLEKESFVRFFALTVRILFLSDILEFKFSDLALRNFSQYFTLYNNGYFILHQINIKLKGLWGERLFQKFDSLNQGFITLEQFVIGLGQCLRISEDEKSYYLFKIYDVKNNNTIGKDELLMMLYNYPKEDLKSITKDPCFQELANLKDYQITSQQQSFAQSRVFFQQQLSIYQQKVEINKEQRKSQLDAMQITIAVEKHIEGSQQQMDEIGDEGGLDKQVIHRIKAKIQDPQGLPCLKEQLDKSLTEKSLILSQNSQTKSQKISPNKKNSQPEMLHTQVPTKAVNITNVIKQYCNYIFNEYETEEIQTLQRVVQKAQTVAQHIYRNLPRENLESEPLNPQDEFPRVKGDVFLKNQLGEFKKKFYEWRANFLFYYDHDKTFPEGIICLDGLNVEELNDHKQTQKFGIEISHKDKIYPSKLLYWDNIDVRRKWMSYFRPFNASIHDAYSVEEKIGSGRYSIVYKGKLKKDKSEWAIKVIDKQKLKEEEQNFLAYETEMIRFLNHAGIIKVKETIENKTTIYIVAELVQDGDLFDYVQKKEFLEEYEARKIMGQLFEVIDYIHTTGIVHRDLKPENIMIIKEKEKDMVQQIKIIDFGFSKFLTPGQKTEGGCGTPNYVGLQQPLNLYNQAPEILQGLQYDFSVDTFALGCIMFFMIRGSLPFDSYIPDEIFQNTIDGIYSLKDQHWDNVTKESKDLIEQLLKKNPEDRISIKDALNHAWFKLDREVLKKQQGINKKGIFDDN